MKKALFFILMVPTLLCAEGPLFQHKDSLVNQEFENLYQDVRSKTISVSSTGVMCIDLPTLCVNSVTNVVTIGTNTITFQDLSIYAQIAGTHTISGQYTFGNRVTAQSSVAGNNGSASTPTFTFTADATKGMYTRAANTVSFALGGVLAFEVGLNGPSFSQARAAARVSNSVENTDNTNTASHAAVDMIVGGTSAGDPFVSFQIPSGANWSFGSDNSDSDKLKISQATTIGTNDCMVVTSAGEVTWPLTPSFLATANAQNNVTGDNTNYDVIFANEIKDQNADYDNTTGVFTASVTGSYAFTAVVYMDGFSGSTGSTLQLVTSNRTYVAGTLNPTTLVTTHPTITVIADLDAADTAFIRVNASGGTKVADISGAPYSYFSGKLEN